VPALRIIAIARREQYPQHSQQVGAALLLEAAMAERFKTVGAVGSGQDHLIAAVSWITRLRGWLNMEPQNCLQWPIAYESLARDGLRSKDDVFVVHIEPINKCMQGKD
jgi:hypothetical protein